MTPPVQEVYVRRIGQSHLAAGGFRLGPADRTFQAAQFYRFGFAFFLVVDNLLHFVVTVDETAFAGSIEGLQHDIVQNRDVARSLVSHMHVVPLGNQPDERTAHRNHIVVRVRTEDQHPLGVGSRPFGTGRIVCVGFAARPT